MYKHNVYVLDISTVSILGYNDHGIIKSSLLYLLNNVFGVTVITNETSQRIDKYLIDLLWNIVYPISFINYILIQDIEIINNELYIIAKDTHG